MDYGIVYKTTNAGPALRRKQASNNSIIRSEKAIYETDFLGNSEFCFFSSALKRPNYTKQIFYTRKKKS